MRRGKEEGEKGDTLRSLPHPLLPKLKWFPSRHLVGIQPLPSTPASTPGLCGRSWGHMCFPRHPTPIWFFSATSPHSSVTATYFSAISMAAIVPLSLAFSP